MKFLETYKKYITQYRANTLDIELNHDHLKWVESAGEQLGKMHSTLDAIRNLNNTDDITKAQLLAANCLLDLE